MLIPPLEYTEIMAEPYELLSRVYDEGWGDFSPNYAEMLDSLLRERGVRRARILDLACGTGLLSLALASLGHTIRGIDISPHMIAAACEKARNQTRVTFETGDMTKVTGPAAWFDAAVCSFDSINYLRRLPEVKQFFAGVARSLKPGGLFLFDSNTEYLYRHHHGDVEQHNFEGTVILEESRYDSRSRTAATLVSFPDGTCEVHYQRPYGDAELSPRLQNAGFSILHRYSWFNGLPFSGNTPKIFYVVEKK